MDNFAHAKQSSRFTSFHFQIVGRKQLDRSEYNVIVHVFFHYDIIIMHALIHIQLSGLCVIETSIMDALTPICLWKGLNRS